MSFVNFVLGDGLTMDDLSQISIIQENSFPRGWQKAAARIDEDGVIRTIGGPKENNPDSIERKGIVDTFQALVFVGDAITQIEKGVMHPKFPFGPKQLEEYCFQLTTEYVENWRKLPDNDPHKFKYLYLDRFLYPFNQLEAARNNLAVLIKENISSNRIQAITWDPARDRYNDEPPCLQIIQIIYLGVDEKDNQKKVDVRLVWRSRDINAVQSNIICLSRALRYFVLNPNNCYIRQWTDISLSLHCYEGSLSKLHEAAWYARKGNDFLIDTPACPYPYNKI